MSSTQLQDLQKDRQRRRETYEKYRDWAAPSMVAVIFNMTLSSSSKQRVEHQSRKELRSAMNDNNVIELIKVIKESHSYRGTSTGIEDRISAERKVTTFQCDTRETLSGAKRRYDIIVKAGTTIGCQLDDKTLSYAFLRGFATYKSQLISFDARRLLADIDEIGAETDVSKIFNRWLRLEGVVA